MPSVFYFIYINSVKDKNGKVYGGLKQQQETSDRLDAESQQIVDEFKRRLAEKYGEYEQFSEKSTGAITQKDIDNLRSIGRKFVNDFKADDIKKPSLLLGECIGNLA